MFKLDCVFDACALFHFLSVSITCMVVGAMVAMLVVVVALVGAVVAKVPSDFLSQAMVVASGGMAGVLVRALTSRLTYLHGSHEILSFEVECKSNSSSRTPMNLRLNKRMNIVSAESCPVVNWSLSALSVTLEFSACIPSLCNKKPINQQHGGGGPAHQVVFCHQVSGEEIKEDYVLRLQLRCCILDGAERVYQSVAQFGAS
ncbi:hypothetical protein Cgig2_031510 [Carnegiea gigantea]|uniref:Uncharacterized protein n=1 Tax=Carnegiea gigantea TaxID=171969 RepID=A0A9Q1K4Y1_9CARY|nr:hypothetical protein Cgig2_031510 [Carnegiea gigantea]